MLLIHLRRDEIITLVARSSLGKRHNLPDVIDHIHIPETFQFFKTWKVSGLSWIQPSFSKHCLRGPAQPEQCDQDSNVHALRSDRIKRGPCADKERNAEDRDD